MSEGAGGWAGDSKLLDERARSAAFAFLAEQTRHNASVQGAGVPRRRRRWLVPLQERIEAVVDDADLEEVCDTERHLLCVACTRARDCLLVTAVAPASEFLDDLRR